MGRLTFPDTPKKITPAKHAINTVAHTQAAGFVARPRGARSMSGVRSSSVIMETLGCSTSIATSETRASRVRFVVHAEDSPFNKSREYSSDQMLTSTTSLIRLLNS